jgi:hypothetical protein
VSELTDRMRTCAAYILDRKNEGDPWAAEIVALDAVDLLVEASNQLSVHLPVEPEAQLMEILQPVASSAPPPAEAPIQASDATWVGPHDTLPAPRSPKACPQCDSRAHKKVFRSGRRLMLACPVCAKEWPYG